MYLVGRRGPLQVAFTIKELREQLKLKTSNTIWRKSDFEHVENVVPNLARPRKRLTELMLKSLNESSKPVDDLNSSYFKPIFFRSPKKFLIDSNHKITGVELTCNKLVGEKLEDQKCVPTNEHEILNCNLAFRSIGYKSIKVDKDILFLNGLVPNNNGVVDNSSSDLAKLYVSGWLGTGPVGVILHTMGNSFQVAKIICEHLNSADTKVKGGFQEIKKIISVNNSNFVDWNGWEKIDKYEVEQGKKLGKPREKICSIEKMIEIARS